MATLACDKTVRENQRGKQREDYAWFLDNRIELHKKYGDAFLAIKNKCVLGAYSSYAEAVNKTKKDEPLGSFIVQECTDSPECYTARVASIIDFNIL